MKGSHVRIARIRREIERELIMNSRLNAHWDPKNGSYGDGWRDALMLLASALELDIEVEKI